MLPTNPARSAGAPSLSITWPLEGEPWISMNCLGSADEARLIAWAEHANMPELARDMLRDLLDLAHERIANFSPADLA